MLAGLSGRQLATITGISQATISRIERGQSLPSLPEVTTWADAANTPEDRRPGLLALAETAVSEGATFRVMLDGGLVAIQEQVQALEASSRTVRNFQPGIVPGLLQTAEYARRIQAFADVNGDQDHAAAAAARLARQEALHDPARSFEFVMTEAALRYRPGPREMLTAQLDHLGAVVTLDTIAFGVIPADAEMHAITRCGFILYEDRLDDQAPIVVVEIPHERRDVTEPDAVERYRKELARFRESAVYGADALDIVRAIAHPG